MNPATAENLPAIDWELCLVLANHKPALAKEILLYVLEQLPGDIQAIKLAEERGDYQEQLRCAHKLHGALCYSGMPSLKAAVAELENFLKKSSFDKNQLTELNHRLDQEVEAVLGSDLPF